MGTGILCGKWPAECLPRGREGPVSPPAGSRRNSWLWSPGHSWECWAERPGVQPSITGQSLAACAHRALGCGWPGCRPKLSRQQEGQSFPAVGAPLTRESGGQKAPCLPQHFTAPASLAPACSHGPPLGWQSAGRAWPPVSECSVAHGCCGPPQDQAPVPVPQGAPGGHPALAHHHLSRQFSKTGSQDVHGSTEAGAQ